MPIGAPVYRFAGTNWTLGGAKLATSNENGYAVFPSLSIKACYIKTKITFILLAFTGYQAI